MIRSLRIRLLMGTLAATACIFLAASGVLYWSIRRVLIREFDATLMAHGDALAALTEQGANGVKTDVTPAQLPGNLPGEMPDFFVVASRTGQVLICSPALAGHAQAFLGAPGPAAPAISSVTLPNGHPGRKLTRLFIPHRDLEDWHPCATTPAPASAMVAIARDIGGLHQKLTHLACLLALIFLSAMVVSGGILWWIVGRGLHPLHLLADEIRTLGSHAMTKRVKTGHVPQELAPVVDRLNELLMGLESAFKRERAFTADAAHELRTPLAGMIMTLQVCASRPRSAEEYQRALNACLDLAGGMRGMVQVLLLMVRIESGQQNPRLEAANLRLKMNETWAEYAAMAGRRRIRVAWDLPDPLPVKTDLALVAMVIRNLLDNAMAYTDEGGLLRIAGQSVPGGAILRMANSGSQVPEQDADKVFNRFWRGDQARQSDRQHCGLGLSLCRRIMTLLGGTIRVETALGGDFAVELHFPDAPTATPTATPSPAD